MNPDDAAPRLSRDDATGDWALWWPCPACGGATILLFPSSDPAQFDKVMAAAAKHMRDQPCPGCVTRRNRSEPGDEPTAWYDTVDHEWVVRVADANGGKTILPLQIRWYDAPRALVEVAAAQLVDASGAGGHFGGRASDEFDPGYRRGLLNKPEPCDGLIGDATDGSR